MFCAPLPLHLLSKNHFISFFWNGVDLPPFYLDDVFKYTVFFRVPLRFTTFVHSFGSNFYHKFLSELLFTPFITTVVDIFYSQLLLKTFVQHFCSHFGLKLMFTSFVHNFCSQLLFNLLLATVSQIWLKVMLTTLVHNFSSYFLLTTYVKYFGSQLLMMSFLHIICFIPQLMSVVL